MRISDWSSDVCSSDLAEIKSRGYPIGILSNGDAAMLQALASRVATPFDHVFSSEAAGFYKPHPSVYHLPLSALKLSGGEVLHVAGGAPDALGATAAKSEEHTSELQSLMRSSYRAF